MNEERLLKILLATHISEKSASIVGQYVFKVASDATKSEIKQAVEHQFNVTIKSVRTCNMKGKSTRFRQIRGRRRSWKKAYVRLALGGEIHIAASA